MHGKTDPLYMFFEKNLLAADPKEDSASQQEEFLMRVIKDFTAWLTTNGHVIPEAARQDYEKDLRSEVLEMLQKTTYGHYNLESYRQQQDPSKPLPTVGLRPAPSPTNISPKKKPRS